MEVAIIGGGWSVCAGFAAARKERSYFVKKTDMLLGLAMWV